MRASLPFQALASVFAAAALGTFAPGCSLGVDPLLESEELVELPPLLEFETPRADLVYSAIDDERPDVPGLNLLVRVRVNDLENGVWLEDIALGAPNVEGGALQRAAIHEDWRGVRCAEIPLALVPGEQTRRVKLIASAGDGLGEFEQEIVVGAAP